MTGDELARRLAEAQALAAEFAESAAQHDRDGTFAEENVARLRRAGWAGMPVPAALGGWGAGLADAVKLLEHLAMGDGSTALAFAMHVQTLGSTVDGRVWRDGAFEALAGEVVAHGVLINACASEPELGSPSRGGLPKTLASRTADGWRIDGHKTFASLSPALDYFIIPAALSDEANTIGRFLVPRGPGVEVVETWSAMGMRATGSHDVHLSGVRVPDDALLYRQSADAPDPARPVANAWFTLCAAAVYLGVAQAAVDEAARYATTRTPTSLGKPISTLESIQRQLGEAELQLMAARTLLYDVANRWQTDTEARPSLSTAIIGAKLFVSNAAISAVDHAMRVVGGASMRTDLPLERYYRDVRAGLYHPPSDEQGFVILGQRALRRAG